MSLIASNAARWLAMQDLRGIVDQAVDRVEPIADQVDRRSLLELVAGETILVIAERIEQMADK